MPADQAAEVFLTYRILLFKVSYFEMKCACVSCQNPKKASARESDPFYKLPFRKCVTIFIFIHDVTSKFGSQE